MAHPSPADANIVTNIEHFQRWAMREMKRVIDAYHFTSLLSGARTSYTLRGRTYWLYPKMVTLMDRIGRLLSATHSPNHFHAGTSSAPSSSSTSSRSSAPSILKTLTNTIDTDSDARAAAFDVLHQSLNRLIAHMTRTLVDDAFEQSDADRAAEKTFFKKALAYACHLRYVDLSADLSTFFQKIAQGEDYKLDEHQYRTSLSLAVASKNADCIMALSILVKQSKARPLDNPLFLALMSGDTSLFQTIWTRSISQNSQSEHRPAGLLMRLLEHIVQPTQMFYSDAPTSSVSPTAQQLLQPLFMPPEKVSAVDAGLLCALRNTPLNVFEHHSLLQISVSNDVAPQNILNYLFNQGCKQSFMFLLKAMTRGNLDNPPVDALLLLASDPNGIQLLDQLCRDLYVYQYNQSRDLVGHGAMMSRDLGFSNLFRALAIYACTHQRQDLWDMLVAPNAHSYNMLNISPQNREYADWMSISADRIFKIHLINAVNKTQSLWAIERLLANDMLCTVLINQNHHIKKLAYDAASLGNNEIARRLMVLSLDGAESVLEGALHAFTHVNATTVEEFQTAQVASITLIAETLTHYQGQYSDTHLGKLITLLIEPLNATKKITGAAFNILGLLLDATTETWQLRVPASYDNAYIQFLHQRGRYQALPIVAPLTFDAFLPQLQATSSKNMPDTAYTAFPATPAGPVPDGAIQASHTDRRAAAAVSMATRSIETKPVPSTSTIPAPIPLKLTPQQKPIVDLRKQANTTHDNTASTDTTPSATSLGQSPLSIFAESPPATSTMPVEPRQSPTAISTMPIEAKQSSLQQPPAVTHAPQIESITPFTAAEQATINKLDAISTTIQALHSRKPEAPVTADSDLPFEPPVFN